MDDPKGGGLTGWLSAFARRASDEAEVEKFVQAVDDEILTRIPELATDPLLVQELHNSTRFQWRAFLHELTQAAPRQALPDQAFDLARSIARRGMDLGVLLKVYREGGKGVFGYLTDLTTPADTDEPARDEILVALWTRAGAWIDSAVENLMETFVEERAHMHEGALARRTAIIDQLLDATATDPVQASATLGHALAHWQTGYVVWTGDARDGGATAESVARAVATALGAPPPLTRAAGTEVHWCWVATPSEPDLAALDELHSRLTEQTAYVAVGTPAQGVDGFRSSHHEARAAQRLAMSATAPPALVRYADVDLLCLTADQPEATGRMVQRVLNDLGADDKSTLLLRQTVLTFLELGQSVERTADALFVHRNTVRYRLARAEQLLGAPLVTQLAHLELALRHKAFFGPTGSG